MKCLKYFTEFGFLTAAIIGASATAKAGDLNATVKGDIVSCYVWRGIYQSGVSFQPTLGIDYKGLSLTAWGSTAFNGKGAKEVDLILGYAIPSGPEISLTDYWIVDEWTGRYFHYGKGTAHQWEATLSYTLPLQKFPLSIGWSTFIAGNDYNADGRRAFSSYLELTYPFSIKKFDFEAHVGASPYKSQGIYGCNGFAVSDVSAKATYTFKPCDMLSIPVFSQVIFNPHASDAHIVFGVSISLD